MTKNYQQGDLVELEIEDLSNNGSGIGRLEGLVIFVPDTVSGDRVLVRLVHLKRQYGQGKLQEILTPSPHRIRPRCIVADKCGGCQWQHIDDDYQRISKRKHIIEALERIGGFTNPPVAPMLESMSPTLGYRNKATYPLARSATGNVQAGYYRPQSHQIINLNQCPIQDNRLNPFLAEIKKDIQERGWSIYNEKSHQGKLRHLSLRIGRQTGEILLTLISNAGNLEGLPEQAQSWLDRYPDLVGVALNYNSQRTNVIFGDRTETIAGQPYLREHLGGIEFHLRPETFFQVNTEATEALLEVIIDQLNLQGHEYLIDAYCGVGTFTLPLAKRVQQAFGIELSEISVQQAENNAQLNHITNATFKPGTVETILPQLCIKPDLIILDPPRQGCDRTVIETLKNLLPPRLVYISCQPATLARDLQRLCQNSDYHLSFLQPVDFFPQTAHVECAAFLQLGKNL